MWSAGLNADHAFERRPNTPEYTSRCDITLYKRLKGRTGARLRVRDWRVIFIETTTTVEVRAVGHRREIYK